MTEQNRKGRLIVKVSSAQMSSAQDMIDEAYVEFKPTLVIDGRYAHSVLAEDLAVLVESLITESLNIPSGRNLLMVDECQPHNGKLRTNDQYLNECHFTWGLKLWSPGENAEGEANALVDYLQATLSSTDHYDINDSVVTLVVSEHSRYKESYLYDLQIAGHAAAKLETFAQPEDDNDVERMSIARGVIEQTAIENATLPKPNAELSALRRELRWIVSNLAQHEDLDKVGLTVLGSYNETMNTAEWPNEAFNFEYQQIVYVDDESAVHDLAQYLQELVSNTGCHTVSDVLCFVREHADSPRTRPSAYSHNQGYVLTVLGHATTRQVGDAE